MQKARERTGKVVAEFVRIRAASSRNIGSLTTSATNPLLRHRRLAPCRSLSATLILSLDKALGLYRDRIAVRRDDLQADFAGLVFHGLEELFRQRDPPAADMTQQHAGPQTGFPGG